MAEMSINDAQTGETIKFDWHMDTPPTQQDMADIAEQYYATRKTPTNNPADYPQQKSYADAARMRAEFLKQEGTIPTRLRNATVQDFVKNIAAEAPRLAQELVTVPLSSAKKAVYGLGAIARTGGDLIRGKSFDESLQSGAGVMANYQPVQGPLDSSMTSDVISAAAEKGINAAENATGNTGFARAGIESGMDIAGLLAAKAPISAIKAVKPQIASAWNTAMIDPVNALSAKLTDMTLKQPVRLKTNIREQNVNTALENGYTPTTAGVDKLKADILAKEAEVAAGVNAGANISGTLDKSVANIEALRGEARRSSNPAAAEKLIDDEIARLQANPNLDANGKISVPTLQQMKVEQGREISQKYQTREGQAVDQFQTKIDKARIRGIKEELEAQLAGVFPELADKNGQLSNLYKLQNVLEAAQSRISNNQGVGIALPLKGGAGATIGGMIGGPVGATIGGGIGAAIGIIEHPKVAPQLAKMLYQSQKGRITRSQANAITMQRLAELKNNLGKVTAAMPEQQNNDPLGIRQ